MYISTSNKPQGATKHKIPGEKSTPFHLSAGEQKYYCCIFAVRLMLLAGLFYADIKSFPKIWDAWLLSYFDVINNVTKYNKFVVKLFFAVD